MNQPIKMKKTFTKEEKELIDNGTPILIKEKKKGSKTEQILATFKDGAVVLSKTKKN